MDNPISGQHPLAHREDSPNKAPQPLAIAEDGKSVATSELVCDVDKAILESFLILIRDNYKKADEAAFFLENRAGITNVHGITNMRDVLSHLATMLDRKTPPEKKRDQLNNAEEHLRRAVLEPYEVALSKLTAEFKTVYNNYKSQVLPNITEHISMHSAPNIAAVDARMRVIADLAAKGRKAKGKNLWTDEWEAGVISYVEAYDKLTSLRSELEEYCLKHTQITQSNNSIRLGRLGIALTVIAFILSIVVTVLITKWFAT
jgi:hypothetical protein